MHERYGRDTPVFAQDRSHLPKLKLPPGACDTHFHFIGPQKQFPLKPNHVFSHLEFEDTPIEDWLKMQEALGLTRGLHVKSMMYENNYEIAQVRSSTSLQLSCRERGPGSRRVEKELARKTHAAAIVG
jgi:hypothetical protein